LRFANFTDPTQRRTGLLRGFGGNKGGDVQANTPDLTPDAATDSRVVFPCTILHIGRLGGLHTVDAESSQARTEWKEKLEEAIGLRKVVQESNRVFEVVTLSLDTLVVPPMFSPPKNQSWNLESPFMGKVTCSVPFSEQFDLESCISGADLFLFLTATADGRARVAVGCAEGVWIGFRHDPRCEDRVAVCQIVTHPTCSHAYAQSAAPEDGHTMCDARRFWDLPRTRRQSKLHFCSHNLDDLIGC
jgi:hypothetical protein